MSEGEDLAKYAESLEQELGDVKARNAELSSSFSAATGGPANGNLVEYQLETEISLDKIEHFLRADVIVRDGETGEVGYGKNPDEKLILLNDYGVNFIMSVLQGYFQKGVFLGYLDEQTINRIMSDIATEIRKFVFCNYEKMGMDDRTKVARFPSLLVQTFHLLEIALMRSWRGKEREIINTSNIVMQNQNMQPNANHPGHSGKEKFNVFKPSTW